MIEKDQRKKNKIVGYFKKLLIAYFRNSRRSYQKDFSKDNLHGKFERKRWRIAGETRQRGNRKNGTKHQNAIGFDRGCSQKSTKIGHRIDSCIHYCYLQIKISGRSQNEFFSISEYGSEDRRFYQKWPICALIFWKIIKNFKSLWTLMKNVACYRQVSCLL